MLIPRPARLVEHPGLGAAVGREPDLELLPFGPPEGYRLDTTGATPRIRAQDAAGVAYALTTLGQLPVIGGQLPAVEIEDRPRCPWRGVRLDVTRGLVLETVLALVDDLAALKLNRLHLGLSGDVSSWPVDEVRRIVEHAAARHLIVVPGIDASALAAADVVRVTRELAELTPDPWLHLGGPGADGRLEPVVRAAAVADRLGRQPIVWHEAGQSSELPRGTIAQYRGALTPRATDGEQLRAIVERDGWAIWSPAGVASLGAGSGVRGGARGGARCEAQGGVQVPAPGDTQVATPAGAQAGAPAGARVPAPGCTPVGAPAGTPLGAPDSAHAGYDDTYGWDPAELVPGVGEDRLLGIEAILDTEPGATIEAIREAVLPRLCALAELMWSPQRGHDVADFTARLDTSPWAGTRPTP